MSRRLPSSQQRPRAHQPTSDNPYKITTLSSLPIPHNYNQPQNVLHYSKDNLQGYHSSSYRGGGHSNNLATYETGLSDDSCTDPISYYDIHNYGYQYNGKSSHKQSDCMFSDNSDSVPYYANCDDIPTRRLSRNNFSDRSFSNRKTSNFCREVPYQVNTHKDPRKVYPKYEGANSRGASNDVLTTQLNLPIPVPLSRLSDRPQSSLSSGVTSAIVDGCGGHCQTFENVCYYFLQVAFAMGILIGTSLSIAGAVLRKSAARNLQVLVYIGVLLSMVSALLLAIQCSARYSARKRKKALRNSKRAPIPLETLHSRPNTTLQVQQPLIAEQTQRTIQISSVNLQPQRSALSEHQGIPWWRRKDLN